jgi:hypothetical protein
VGNSVREGCFAAPLFVLLRQEVVGDKSLTLMAGSSSPAIHVWTTKLPAVHRYDAEEEEEAKYQMATIRSLYGLLVYSLN